MGKETVPMERMKYNVLQDIVVVERFNAKTVIVHHRLLFAMVLMIVEMVQMKNTVSCHVLA